MINYGKVKSVHHVAGKTIATVKVHKGNDDIILDQVAVKFGDADNTFSLGGCKWWPDRREVDLLFDERIETLDVGVPAFIIPRN